MASLKFALVFCSLAVLFTAGSKGRAQILTDVPEHAQAIRVDEMLGAMVARNGTFLDSNGGPFPMDRLLAKKLPILLTLNYSGCPGLCVAQLNGLTEGISEMQKLVLGKDFLMVSVSIDPAESDVQLAGMKSRYASSIPNNHDLKSWYFLRGDQATIKRLADSVGFHYTYDAKHKRYNHASCAIVISPSGIITRYLFDIGFKPETIRLALVEASDGRVGSLSDQILLSCFHYNAEEGRYSADAKKLLSIAAAAFVMMGLAMSAPFWFHYRKPRVDTGSQNDQPVVSGNLLSRDDKVNTDADSTVHPGG